MEIVSKIESQAYYEGCHLAVGFGGTACKATLCPNSKYAVLKREESCRFAGRSCPSMHGAVMDLVRMAVRAGQYIYPGGTATKTMDVPFVSYLGLILIDW